MTARDGRSRVAVVTGGGGLIGRELCGVLEHAGHAVVAVDVGSLDVPGTLRLEVDVSDPNGMHEAAGAIEEAFGHVDWLIHAAALTGRTRGRQLTGDLASLNLEVWNEVLAINLTGALVCVQSLLPLLTRSAGPRIVIIGSIQGTVPTLGSGAYGVSKAGLAGLTRQLAAELAQRGITVNMVSPGPVADASELARLGNAAAERPTPLGRYGDPAEVALATVGLLGDEYGFMTGAIIPIDGGEHLRPRTGPARAHPYETHPQTAERIRPGRS